MVVFYVGLAVGLVLAVVYLGVSALSFVRIRRQLITGAADVVDTAGREGVGLVPGFRWKASLAVLTSFVVLLIASFSGLFWYVLALSGLGTAGAVIAAFVLELRSERTAPTS
jgi:hypothetical protein